MYISRNKCAYIEGVTSAYSVLEGNVTPEEQAGYLEEINFWLSQSESLQIKNSSRIRTKFDGHMYQTLKVSNPQRGVGGFLTATNEPVQRIDFTQHCLSAFLQNIQDSLKQDLKINSAFHHQYIVGVIDQFVEQVNINLNDERIEAVIYEMAELENKYNEES